MIYCVYMGWTSINVPATLMSKPGDSMDHSWLRWWWRMHWNRLRRPLNKHLLIGYEIDPCWWFKSHSYNFPRTPHILVGYIKSYLNLSQVYLIHPQYHLGYIRLYSSNYSPHMSFLHIWIHVWEIWYLHHEDGYPKQCHQTWLPRKFTLFFRWLSQQKKRQFGFLNTSHIFPAIPFLVSGISHVDTLKNIRNISVVWGVSEAASRRLVKDLEVRDELRSTCRRASHWGTSLHSTVIYLIYTLIYTHIRV